MEKPTVTKIIKNVRNNIIYVEYRIRIATPLQLFNKLNCYKMEISVVKMSWPLAIETLSRPTPNIPFKTAFSKL